MIAPSFVEGFRCNFHGDSLGLEMDSVCGFNQVANLNTPTLRRVGTVTTISMKLDLAFYEPAEHAPALHCGEPGALNPGRHPACFHPRESETQIAKSLSLT
jgi:hypothetical protein